MMRCSSKSRISPWVTRRCRPISVKRVGLSKVDDQGETSVGEKRVIKATGFGGKPDAMVQPAMKVLSIETVGDGSGK